MNVPTLHVVASVLAWMSATINPFIYAFKNRQYQQAFKKVPIFTIVFPLFVGGGGVQRKIVPNSFISDLIFFTLNISNLKSSILPAPVLWQQVSWKQIWKQNDHQPGQWGVSLQNFTIQNFHYRNDSLQR